MTSRRWQTTIAVPGFYLLLAFVTTLPLGLQPGTLLPANADAVHFTASLSWVSRSLTGDPANLLDAPWYYPAEHALLLGEPAVGLGIVAVPFWLATKNAAATYNGALILTLALNAYFAFLLLRELSLPVWVAVIGGEIFAFTTANYDSAARIQVMSAQWTPLLFLFLVRLVRRNRLVDGLGLGLAAAMQALSCNYFALFLATLLAVTLPGLARVTESGRWRSLPWGGIVSGVVLATALVGPLALLQADRLDAVPGDRPVRVGALPWGSYSNVLPQNWLYGGRIGEDRVPYDDRHFPGMLPLLLGGIGLLGLWQRRRERAEIDRWTGYFVVFGLVAFAFGLGRIQWSGGDILGPYGLLDAWIPGYSFTRVPSRFAMLVRLSLSILATTGVLLVAERWLRGRRRAFLVVLALLVPLEHLSTPIETWSVPDGATRPEVYDFIRGLDRPSPLLEFPINPSRTRRDEATWLALATYHWQPILNGFGPYHSPWHFFVVNRLVESFPDGDTIRLLRALGVRYVVFHPDYGGSPETLEARTRFAANVERYPDQLVLVRSLSDRGRYEGDLGRLGGERVYRVDGPKPEIRSSAVGWTRQSVAGWRCGPTGSGCERAFDGDLDTAFTTAEVQQPGHFLRLRFPAPLRTAGVSLVSRPPGYGFPRDVRLVGRDADGKRHDLADFSRVDSVEFLRDLQSGRDRVSLDLLFEKPIDLEVLTIRIGPLARYAVDPWEVSEVEVLAAK